MPVSNLIVLGKFGNLTWLSRKIMLPDKKRCIAIDFTLGQLTVLTDPESDGQTPSLKLIIEHCGLVLSLVN